jgi:hypothetical protein
MGFNPHDDALTDGRVMRKYIEDRPVDKKDRTLMRNDAPQPDWGRGVESQLRAKRGPTGRSTHPGFPRGGR